MCETKDWEYNEESKHKRKKEKISYVNQDTFCVPKEVYERRLGTVCVYIRSRVCYYYDYTGMLEKKE